MLSLVPRAPELRLDAGAERLQDERVGREQVTERDALVGRITVVAGRNVDWQYHGDAGITRTALREQIEVPQLDDLVAPELQAHRLGHAETVDVEDAAAHAVLADVVHHRHALKAMCVKMFRQRLESPRIALPQFEARARDGAGELRAFHQRA